MTEHIAESPPSVGSEKPALLLVHGFMGTCKTHFGKLLPHIKHRFRVFPLDLPGHAGKALPESDFYQHCLEHVRAALTRVGPAHVVGLSYLGGSLALRASLSSTRLVRSLIVSGIALDVPLARFVAWNNAFTQIAYSNPEVQEQFESLHGDNWRNTVKIVTSEIERRYSDSVCLNREIFSALRVPTLLINGGMRSDEASAVEALADVSEHVEGRVVEESGHLVPLEHPTRFMEHAEIFWNSREILST